MSGLVVRQCACGDGDVGTDAAVPVARGAAQAQAGSVQLSGTADTAEGVIGHGGLDAGGQHIETRVRSRSTFSRSDGQACFLERGAVQMQFDQPVGVLEFADDLLGGGLRRPDSPRCQDVRIDPDCDATG